MKKLEQSPHCIGPASAHGPSTVGPADGQGGAGSVTRQPGEARVHAGCGWKGGLSLRWLVGGEAAEERRRSDYGGTLVGGGDIRVDL
jgi:hypothetical protein